MPKEQRVYSIYKKVDGSETLVELISVEETYSQDRALDLAIERIPESDRVGDYAAVVGMKWKPYGERVVKMTGWGEAEAPRATHRDSSGKAPLPGQTDLAEAGVPVDGVPIPEAEVAVEPIPHKIETTDESTIDQAKAKREEQLAADRARAREEEKAAQHDAAIEEAREGEIPGRLAELQERDAAVFDAIGDDAPRQVADGIAAVQERRKAAEEAKRDETPAPVNAPDSGFAPPSDW